VYKRLHGEMDNTPFPTLSFAVIIYQDRVLDQVNLDSVLARACLGLNSNRKYFPLIRVLPFMSF